MPNLIEIFLPANKSDAREKIEAVEHELVDQFGGVTLYINAPAGGLWDGEDGVIRDTIVVIEVMADDVDRTWWAEYRHKLECRFEQNEILIRASTVARL